MIRPAADAETFALCRAAELLLETQIYQVDKKTLLGMFPVYIVNPDFPWYSFPLPTTRKHPSADIHAGHKASLPLRSGSAT